MNDVLRYSNTERLYVAQFGGELIKDARQWEIDADVLTSDGWGYLIPVQKILDAGFQYTALSQEYTTR